MSLHLLFFFFPQGFRAILALFLFLENQNKNNTEPLNKMTFPPPSPSMTHKLFYSAELPRGSVTPSRLEQQVGGAHSHTWSRTVFVPRFAAGAAAALCRGLGVSRAGGRWALGSCLPQFYSPVRFRVIEFNCSPLPLPAPVRETGTRNETDTLRHNPTGKLMLEERSSQSEVYFIQR